MTTYTKNIMFFVLILSFSLNSLASSEADCTPSESFETTCTYEGITGLELLKDVHLHQIQRLPVYSSITGRGSLVLITNTILFGTEYSSCWALTQGSKQIVILYCGPLLEENGVPEVILKDLRK